MVPPPVMRTLASEVSVLAFVALTAKRVLVPIILVPVKNADTADTSSVTGTDSVRTVRSVRASYGVLAVADFHYLAALHHLREQFSHRATALAERFCHLLRRERTLGVL